MKREKIKAEKRKILGKKVKKLRKEGIIPANMYGKHIKSESIQVFLKDFIPVYSQAKETGLVDLVIGDKTIPILIQNVQKDFRGNILHADFFAVNLKEKVKATVPIKIVGEPKAVSDKVGILMNILNEVEVEALPENLPENIEINVVHLANIDDQVTVADLKAPAGVEILTDKEQIISKIGELVTKEAAEQAAAEQEAAEQAAAESGAAEGAPLEDKTQPGAEALQDSEDTKEER
jgi:large subunit ribosomal protein L25